MAGNALSSSLLPMLPRHLDAAPESAYVATEAVQVKRLDTVFHEFHRPGDRSYLKVDTQGFEHKILAGAAASLPEIEIVQLELALVPLYGGEMLFGEMQALMQELGYGLISLDVAFEDPQTGQLLQLDGTFRRLPMT